VHKGAAPNRHRRERILKRRNVRRRTLSLAAFAVCAFAAGCLAVGEHAPQAASGEAFAARDGLAGSAAADGPQMSLLANSGKQHFAAITPRVKPERPQREPAKQANDPVVVPSDLPSELSMLLGLSDTSIIRIFGQPHTVERNGASLIWNYETSGCSLQIVFYADIEDQTYHALQYALADGNGEKPVDIEPCLNRIQSANHDGH